MRASVAVAKAREFISGPHSLKAFCDKPLAPRTQSNQRGQKILTSFMKILFEKLASSSGLRASNMYPDYKYSSNSSDTSLEISLYSPGLISSCIKSALIASLHCLLVTFFTNVFVWESLGILTVTFPDGFLNTIFTPCFRRSATFIWLSISLSCTNKADEVFTAFSKVRDFFDRMRGGTSLNGVLPIGEWTRTDFDFLHGGLALSGVSRFLLLVFTGVDFIVVAFLTKWYNWPKFRILRPHGLQTRSENLELSCTKENPTWRTISLKTTPKHSFRFEGLKIFTDEEWLCFGRFPNWILKETLKAYSCHSHSYRTSCTICSWIWRLGSRVFVFCRKSLSKTFK